MATFWPNGTRDNRPRVTNAFGVRHPRYSRGWHTGDDTAGYAYNHTPADGVVVFAGYDGSYGNTVIVDHGSGIRSRTAHGAPGGILVRAGQRVAAGQRLLVQGTTGLSTGVHNHQEIIRADGSFIAPMEWIAARIAAENNGSAAGGGSTPFTPPPPPRRRQKEDPMLVLEISTGTAGKHIALLSQGVFSHVVPDDRPDILGDITDSKRTFQVDLPYLARLLRLWGCDRDIWDIRDGKFVVLDPLGGSVAQGNTWTAERAVRGAIAGIKLPEIDTKPIVAAVAEALADGRDYDAGEIAKAVNDDAARRLAG